MTADLLAWLTAAMDAAQHRAERASGNEWMTANAEPGAAWVLNEDMHLMETDAETAAHVVAHDPKSVLRRVSVDRRTLQLHDRGHECSSYDEHTHEVDGYRFILEGETCTTVWLLAEAYGHPDVPKCGETSVFWPDDEACDAVCIRPVLHEGPHEDEILGEWED